jgi:hypothetical protein
MFARKMCVRKVAVRLKPNTLEKFTSLLESEILPWLRTQEGFLDLITLALPDGSEVQALSFWDQDADLQAYNSSGYPAVLKKLQTVLDGAPYVKTFEVVFSTLDRFAISPADIQGDVEHPGTPLGCSS